MHPIFYIIGFYLILGVIGVLFANRNQPKLVRNKRWLKVWVFVLITLGIVSSILYCKNCFSILGSIIILSGMGEMLLVPGHTHFRKRLDWRQINWYYIVFYILIAMGFLSFVFNATKEEILYVFVLVFTFDSFSQVVGQAFGNRKLFPRISPQKTIAGLMGGLFMTVLTAIIVKDWLLLSIQEAILLGFVFSIASLLGDFLASYYKRYYKVKDFSKMLPGQGGVLDRFDSLIFSGAVAYFGLFI